MNLCLYDDQLFALQKKHLSELPSLVGAKTDVARRDSDAELGKQLLGLVFVNVHLAFKVRSSTFKVSERLPLIDGDNFQPDWPCIDALWANEAIVGELFDDVGGPTGGAGNGKDRS